MRKLTYLSVLIVFTNIIWAGAGVWLPAASANSKTSELQQKVADIALLHQQLGDRIEQANEMREVFEQQRRLLTDEIAELKNSRDTSNSPTAGNTLRVRYNKELLRIIAAYSSQLDAKVVFFETGQAKLSYLQKLAFDDIRMIDTLKDLEIDALMTQISLVINIYLAEAHTIRLDPVDILSPVPEETWQILATQQK